ncbi:MAG TPA: IgGFc-binding protein, partial [Polyangia bacterium]
WTDEPFVVRSQDAAHPIHLAGMMTGGHFMRPERQGSTRTSGDPEFVNAVPTDQYKNDITFFTDPTYPETTLVVVRKPGANGRFSDVSLGCSGVPLAGWTSVGPLEFTRVDLVRDRRSEISGCHNGVHRMTSANPFAVTVWGTGPVVSYAYPGGTALRPINDVIIVP